MKKVLMFFCFSFWVILLQGQTCGNPGAKLKWLREAGLDKNKIYQWVKNDLAIIQPQKHDTIADIGSYNGYYPSLYSVYSDSAVFYLNDISLDGFVYFDSIQTICKQIKGSNLSNKFIIVHGQDSSTNLQKKLFNKVVLRDVLHHFKLMDVMLEDIKKIMKPKAKLILFEPIRGRSLNEERLCRGAMTIDQLLNLLNKHGFTLVRELPQTDKVSWFEFKLKNE
jgi:SAM-dependent methyltransferase